MAGALSSSAVAPYPTRPGPATAPLDLLLPVAGSVSIMRRLSLTDRILDLLPSLAEVRPWDWGETEEGEPW